MSPENKAKHLDTLNQLISVGEESLSSIESARNTADSAKTSRYDGQREIFAQDANVQRGLVTRLTAFRDFIGGTKRERQIEFGAEFTVKFDDGDTMEDVIFAPIAVKFGGVDVVTPESPIGKAVQHLTAGERFSYPIGRGSIAGIIFDVK